VGRQEQAVTEKNIGYCETCGDSLWNGIEHACRPTQSPLKHLPPSLVRVVSELLGPLVLADIELSGHPDKLDPGRARAAVRRALRSLGITEGDYLFYRIQSSAEAFPPTSWD
jgi:hypothetical protein